MEFLIMKNSIGRNKFGSNLNKYVEELLRVELDILTAAVPVHGRPLVNVVYIQNTLLKMRMHGPLCYVVVIFKFLPRSNIKYVVPKDSKLRIDLV